MSKKGFDINAYTPKYHKLKQMFPNVTIRHGWQDDGCTPDYTIAFCRVCDIYEDGFEDYDGSHDYDTYCKIVINQELLDLVDDVIECCDCGACSGW